MMTNKIVEVKHLSHRYNVDWAIKDINFEIVEKGVIGLLGSNGAGKSTTMNIICNVLNPTEGDIFINGINLRKNPIEAKKYMGFLPQKAPLHTDLTVYEYLYHCADIHLISKELIPEAIAVAMRKCGITHYSRRLISNLSGGYQQRVGIAQAIIHNPLFVILDEPTNGLDPNQILEIRQLIKDIAVDKAVLISTHILTEVQATCEYIKMIDNGNIVFSGSIKEFNDYSAPNTLVAIMSNAPSNEEFMKIETITKIERLTKERIRIHFKEDEAIIDKIVEISVEDNWGIKEIFLEKDSLDTIFAKLSGK